MQVIRKDTKGNVRVRVPAPAKVIPQYAGLDRQERCILSAREMAAFCA